MGALHEMDFILPARQLLFRRSDILAGVQISLLLKCSEHHREELKTPAGSDECSASLFPHQETV